MLNVGTRCEVVGGWIHGFEVGEVVTVLNVRYAIAEPGDINPDVFVDCVNSEGLVQSLYPSNIRKI